MKRILCSLIPIPVVVALAWLAGYDFDQRNWGVAYIAFITFAACGLVYISPEWRDE